ncbi:hypothetical protein COP2_013857 [Malus domestica]
MPEQRRKDQVVAVKFLIKRLLVYGRDRKQEMDSSAKEEEKWKEETSSSQNKGEKEFFGKELEAAIQMAECINDLDWPEDMPESPKLVKFLCVEPDKIAPDVQDPLKTIDLGTEGDPRPIQISGLLEVEDRARIVSFLHEFKDCFA